MLSLDRDRTKASIHEKLRTVKPCERLAEKVDSNPPLYHKTKRLKLEDVAKNKIKHHAHCFIFEACHSLTVAAAAPAVVVAAEAVVARSSEQTRTGTALTPPAKM